MIIGGSDAIHAYFIDDERAAVVQLGENVRRLGTLDLQQSVFRHRMHDDDALAFVVPTDFILTGGG